MSELCKEFADFGHYVTTLGTGHEFMYQWPKYNEYKRLDVTIQTLNSAVQGLKNAVDGIEVVKIPPKPFPMYEVANMTPRLVFPGTWAQGYSESRLGR